MITLHLSKRERNAILVGIVFVLCIVLYTFVIEPLVTRFQDMRQKITVKELKVRKNLKILKNKDNIEAEYQKFADYMKQKTSDEQEMATLLSDVESAAQKLDIRITDMKPRKTKMVDFYKTLAVELEAEGQLEQITEFIHAVQNLPYLLSVDRLRLERRSARKQTLRSHLLIGKILIP
ncbi:type 4a pilus biogenesis protein PilO [Candidatus Omnitrophota bacterium]